MTTRLSLGMMGMHGEATGTLAVQECDLLIGLGMRFDDRLTGATKSFAPKAKIVHFEIDPSEIEQDDGDGRARAGRSASGAGDVGAGWSKPKAP